MKKSKYIEFLLLILLAVISTTAIAAGVEAKKLSPPSVQEKGNYLFVVNAGKGKIEKKKGKYYLILHDVHPRMLYFSNRPGRVAGFMTVDKFFKETWVQGKESFVKNSPNAAIVTANVDAYRHGVDTPFAVDIIQPPQKIGRNKWQLLIEVLDKQQLKQGELGTVTLFIDDAAGIMRRVSP